MFGVPIVWREPEDHSTDCYFCLMDIKGRNRKGKKSIVYPDLQSAIRSVLHSSDIPVPQPPSELPSDDTSSSDDSESQDATEMRSKTAESMDLRTKHCFVVILPDVRRSDKPKVHLDWSVSRAGPARGSRSDDIIHATPLRHSQY
ncbi:hypothetical protein O3P69_006229 [Scylla paramamosain]|uniref:Uncharacterized protein n=1 Tax=Scylla paramamosain TaxID=85552 RepID=A0AAW0U851_SCYPA